MKRIIPGRGCPICGHDYSAQNLPAQKRHVEDSHGWWQQFVLRRRTRIPLVELLLQRKYRVGRP